MGSSPVSFPSSSCGGRILLATSASSFALWPDCASHCTRKCSKPSAVSCGAKRSRRSRGSSERWTGIGSATSRRTPTFTCMSTSLRPTTPTSVRRLRSRRRRGRGPGDGHGNLCSTSPTAWLGLWMRRKAKDQKLYVADTLDSPFGDTHLDLGSMYEPIVRSRRESNRVKRERRHAAARLQSHRARQGAHSASKSGFEGLTEEGETLSAWLKARDVTDLDVVGIATDHCVKATALDGARAGFTVQVLLDYTADVADDTTRTALDELRRAGVALSGEPVVA
ncbi:isochorismatase family protein [Nonomuraea sp. NPDC003560]|uniref:isochorismatase family protein n=1 Tax=Nonomuraea sp. NPDC003560 TaxID=3364341 RepID=UPI0036A1DC65